MNNVQLNLPKKKEPISVASRKAKGRNLQKLVRDLILSHFPFLTPDDVRSTGMGQSGLDVQLSPAAQDVFPFAVEAKAKNSFSIYKLWEQAVSNKTDHMAPLLVIKQDRKDPLVVLDLNRFMELLK